jgi:hypothetical protein
MLWRPSAYELARRSYGPEPRRRPEEVSKEERVEAVLHRTVKYLLRDVMGIEALMATSPNLYPAKFRALLPITETDVHSHVRAKGLPSSIVRYERPDNTYYGQWIYQVDQKWVLSSYDARGNRDDKEFSSKWEAELDILRLWRSVLSEYVIRGAS